MKDILYETKFITIVQTNVNLALCPKMSVFVSRQFYIALSWQSHIITVTRGPLCSYLATHQNYITLNKGGININILKGSSSTSTMIKIQIGK
jgi:hypothetical protein